MSCKIDLPANTPRDIREAIEHRFRLDSEGMERLLQERRRPHGLVEHLTKTAPGNNKTRRD